MVTIIVPALAQLAVVIALAGGNGADDQPDNQ
jgi:hypothetical protein